MILDSLNTFCDAVALNLGLAGTYLIGSQVDQLKTTALPGNSDSLYFVAEVQTTCTSAGAATLQLELASDATAAIATDGSATNHFLSAAIPVATLVAGYRICAVELPRGNYERFLGVLQITGTAAFTAGKVNCYLTNDPNALNILPAPYQA